MLTCELWLEKAVLLKRFFCVDLGNNGVFTAANIIFDVIDDHRVDGVAKIYLYNFVQNMRHYITGCTQKNNKKKSSTLIKFG